MAKPKTQRAIKPLTTDEPHLPGTVLRTDNPLVGVLVERWCRVPPDDEDRPGSTLAL